MFESVEGWSTKNVDKRKSAAEDKPGLKAQYECYWEIAKGDELFLSFSKDMSPVFNGRGP
jgi:hypothetical protein